MPIRLSTVYFRRGLVFANTLHKFVDASQCYRVRQELLALRYAFSIIKVSSQKDTATTTASSKLP